jgi:hypothetical protein
MPLVNGREAGKKAVLARGGACCRADSTGRITAQSTCAIRFDTLAKESFKNKPVRRKIFQGLD